MVKNSMGAACATVLIALAGGLAIPTASHAAVYTGVYDPENNDYKWFGNHVFTVDDSCLLNNGWQAVNYDGAASYCGSASLSGGDLTVVNKQGTVGTGDDVSKTLQFSNFLFIPDTARVWGVYVVDGQLAGVDTEEIGNFLFDNPGTTHAGTWTLEWSSGQGSKDCLWFGSGCPLPPPPPLGGSERAGLSGLLGAPVASGMSVPNDSTVTLRNFVVGSGLNQALNNLGPSTSVTFQAVPEPTTVTLVLAALGAGWMARRRKKP